LHISAVVVVLLVIFVLLSKCMYHKVLHTDLKVPKIRDEITKFSVKYRDKIIAQPNELAFTRLEGEEARKLKRFKPTDLTTRFS
jgi:predicted RNase H-like nuclease